MHEPFELIEIYVRNRKTTIYIQKYIRTTKGIHDVI